MRRERFGAAGLLAALGLLALAPPIPAARPAAADDASARPGLLARLPDGRRLDLRCAGGGRPTVLLDGGFAATSLAWSKVQPQLAKTYRVCAYDRAGYGFSDPGPAPRDGAAVAKDLDQALRAARIAGPFVVVGHSAGGLYVRLFADRRARDVVGMVLVDPSVEYQDRRLAAVFGPGAGSLAPLRERAQRCLDAARRGALPSTDPRLTACAPGPKSTAPAAVVAARLAEARRTSTWETQISELDTLWTRTSDEIAAGRQSYGDMPLIVLTAEGTYAGAPPRAKAAVDQVWRDLHREVAARSTHGEERLVTGSSHMMIFDRPDAIVSAVGEVVIQAAARRAGRRAQ